MNIQIKDHAVPPIELTEKASAFQNHVLNKYQGFSASLPERKTPLVLGDALLVGLAAFGALLLWRQTANTEVVIGTQIIERWYWFPILFSGWLVLAWLNDLYRIPSSFDKMASATRVAVVGMMNLGLFLGVYFLIPNQLPRAYYLFFLAIVWPGITLWRFAYATVLVKPSSPRRALIVGTGRTARTMARAIEEHDPDFEIVGYVDGESTEAGRDIKDVPVLRKWHNLSTFARDNFVSDIILAKTGKMPADQLQAVMRCFEQGVRVVPMPKLFEEITGRIPVEHIDERWLVFLPMNWDSRGLYLIIKRAMDIVIAGIGLLLLAPLFPLLVLAIKLDSPGPIFYRPERLGRGGKPFRVWKFRTMVPNADSIGDPTFTTSNDRRITRVGRILRLTHVDELPQFINIVAGDMSVVGPRPERLVPELEEHIPYYRTRSVVKPGATGWALVKQGYAEGVEDTLIKLQYDLYYIRHQSLSFDIFILFKSAIHMLTMGGR